MHKLNPFIVLVFLLQTTCSFCQKANVNVIFPENITGKNIDVNFFYNGTFFNAEHKTMHIQPNQTQINIIDSFYTPLATIQIVSTNKKDSAQTYSSFYVWNEPANITFLSPDLKEFKIRNAYCLDTLNTAYNNLVTPEWDAFSKFQDTLQQNPDSANWKRNADIVNNICYKTMDFIKLNRANLYESYFCFELFKYQVAGNQFANPDTLLNFFENNFNDNLKTTSEGKFISDRIYGLAITKTKGSTQLKAPDFNTTDIFGKKVNLKNEFNKKMVLINFWATWCGPCVAELPAIKKIADAYSSQLKVISISSDRDSSKFVEDLKKYKMDWINIYGNDSINYKFGAVSSIPQLYLIDKNGNIIYNRNFDETDFTELKGLNAILKNNLK